MGRAVRELRIAETCAPNCAIVARLRDGERVLLLRDEDVDQGEAELPPPVDELGAMRGGRRDCERAELGVRLAEEVYSRWSDGGASPPRAGMCAWSSRSEKGTIDPLRPG